MRVCGGAFLSAAPPPGANPHFPREGHFPAIARRALPSQRAMAGATLWFSANPADAPTLQNLKDADDLPTPTPSECSDYWDPPCRVCKKVDNEPNVLCDICNSAYHLECIANIKPPLPRTPDDDEWFCRPCIKRGIPESIIDRVGRRAPGWLGGGV